MPKISIIVPIYNSVEFLREAINSIVNQTYSDWEMIVINEYGSDDGSKELVESFGKYDKRIRLIQNSERLGIAESMNVGIEAAQGQYIARMDADDISMPKRFEKQLAYMENHPEIAMCGVKVEIFGSNPFEWKLETDAEQLSTDILFYSPCVHPTIMIRKSFMDEYAIRYNKDYRASEDYDLFSKICKDGKVANLNEVLFKYRIMENNATFKNNDIGMIIYNEVMERQFLELGLSFSDAEIKLLSPHYSVKGMDGVEALKAIEKLDVLLQKIFIANEKVKKYNRSYLWRTLRKRYKETCDSTEWFCKGIDRNKVEMLYSHSVFAKEYFYVPQRIEKNETEPEITVLLPAYNSEDYIMGTIWSVLEQSYSNFEILIMNEFGSDDDTVFITSIFDDARIRVIQNEEKLGLAESLNLGIREARGKYIARMDADDTCHPDRLKLQREFLEENEDYGICGSWQHHFGVNAEWLHKCSVSNEDIEAELIFNCDLCHSTLMLRKQYFIENNLFYDSTYAAEDYELWTRAITKFKIANLPLVLGEYRVGESNITAKKMDKLSLESGQLAARNIEKYFGFKLPEEMVALQSGWRNEFSKLSSADRAKALEKEKRILKKMWDINHKTKVLSEDSLLKTINKKWRTITNTQSDDATVYGIDELFKKFSYNHINVTKIKLTAKKLSLKHFVKRILRRPYYAVKCRTVDVILQNIWNSDGHLYDYYSKLMQEAYDIDGHVYDYYNKLLQEIRNLDSGREKFETDIVNSIVTSEQSLFTHEEKILLDAVALQTKSIDENVNKIFDVKSSVVENSLNEAFDKKIAQLESNISVLLSDTLNNILESIIARNDERMQKAEESINIKVDGRIWEAEQNIIKMQELLAELLLEFQVPKKKLVLMNTPLHDNVGDHAIAYAEKMWIKNETDFHVIDIPGNVYRQYHTIIRKFIKEDDVIAITGGGFVGSIWKYEQDLVEQVISEYPNNAVRIFPQSVFFADDAEGKEALNKAKKIFQKHDDLIVFVREELSYEFMKENFPDCKTVLSVDMALYLKKYVKDLKINGKREGIGLCFKNDKESVLSEEQKQHIVTCAARTAQNVESFDTAVGYDISVEDRCDEIMSKLTEFAGYSLVITDRLHGIIFSIITSTPCIVIGGLSHKNDGMCKMFAGYDGICYVDDLSEMDEIIRSGGINWKQDDNIRLDNLINGGLKCIYDMLKQ